MSTFYTNKYPIKNAITGKTKEYKLEDLPVGTVFIVHCIWGDTLQLKPINHPIEACMNTQFSVEMLNFAFTASDEFKDKS